MSFERGQDDEKLGKAPLEAQHGALASRIVVISAIDNKGNADSFAGGALMPQVIWKMSARPMIHSTSFMM